MKFPLHRFAALASVAVMCSVVQPAMAGDGEFPDSYYFFEAKRPDALRKMEGKEPPPLTLTGWIGEQQDLADLKGKVVVVDFWATWCGPCMNAIPHNVKLFKAHQDDGLMIIGVHDSKRGQEKMAAVAKDKKINYPLAIDVDGQSTKAYNVPFWPTYVVIDRKGIVRAAGLAPDNVDKVVAKLLKEGKEGAGEASDAKPAEKAAAPKGEMPSLPVGTTPIPADWRERDPAKEAKLQALLDADAGALPAIKSDRWINSEPLNLADLKGKVVMLDFWGVWCPPCIGSIPHTNELLDKYGDKGLVIIGVCHPRRVDEMAKTAEAEGIRYPICADGKGEITAAYAADSFPDYYFIDRSGKMRIADCKNGEIDKAIELLLAEKP